MDALKLLLAVANVLFGVVSLVAPKRLAEAVGLGVDTPDGLAEIRNGWGGLYLALGLTLLVLQAVPAYQVAGAMYAGMGVTRLAQMLTQKSLRTPIQAGILAFEAVSAVIFLG